MVGPAGRCSYSHWWSAKRREGKGRAEGMRGLVWRHSLPLPLQRNRDAKVPHRPRPGVPPSLPPSLSFREVNWFWKSQKLPPHLAPPPSGATTCHLPIGATERMCSVTTKSFNEVGSGLGPLQGGCLHHHGAMQSLSSSSQGPLKYVIGC